MYLASLPEIDIFSSRLRFCSFAFALKSSAIISIFDFTSACFIDCASDDIITSLFFVACGVLLGVLLDVCFGEFLADLGLGTTGSVGGAARSTE